MFLTGIKQLKLCYGQQRLEILSPLEIRVVLLLLLLLLLLES